MLTRRAVWAVGSGVGTAGSGGLADQSRCDGGDRHLPGFAQEPHHTPKAKRVIYLFQSETFPFGPVGLQAEAQRPVRSAVARSHPQWPASDRDDGQSEERLPVAASQVLLRQQRRRHVDQRAAAAHVDDRRQELCVVDSTFTEAINHDPAITYIQTGSQIPGRPSLGAWLGYGLGSENEDLPHYRRHAARSTQRSAESVRPAVGTQVPAVESPGNAPEEPAIRFCTSATRLA